MDSAEASSIGRVIRKIEKDLSEIKERMIDIDSVLTEDDYRALIDYRAEKARGRLILHEDLKKELGL